MIYIQAEFKSFLFFHTVFWGANSLSFSFREYLQFWHLLPYKHLISQIISFQKKHVCIYMHFIFNRMENVTITIYTTYIVLIHLLVLTFATVLT